MPERKETIRALSRLSLTEGEGLGTAYEYYVKLRKLRRFLGTIPRPKKILIAGLPEKYGSSLDFIYLARELGADVTVLDDRAEALDKARTAAALPAYGEGCGRISFIQAEKIADAVARFSDDDRFDLALSSEVVQRLGEDRDGYISGLQRLAKHAAVFAPNGANAAHARRSRLAGLGLEELMSFFQKTASSWTVCDHGYVDMPPFPPGLSRSPEKREKAVRSRFEACLMKGLEGYSLCENIYPRPLKSRVAHIVYVIAKSRAPNCHDRQDSGNGGRYSS
jgi:hypothetical protein